MKMYGVKETICAGITSAIIECEHGKFEVVLDVSGNIKAGHLFFYADYFNVDESYGECDTRGHIVRDIDNICSGWYTIDAYSDSYSSELAERAELLTLCASVVAYLHQ